MEGVKRRIECLSSIRFSAGAVSPDDDPSLSGIIPPAYLVASLPGFKVLALLDQLSEGEKGEPEAVVDFEFRCHGKH